MTNQSSGDGSVLTYGGNIFGNDVKTKKMPTGVTCELLADFKSNAFKVSSPDLVNEMMSGKGLPTIYSEWKQAVLRHKGTLGTFSWPKVQGVIEDFQSKFNEKGVKVFLCNLREDAGIEGSGNNGDFVKWFEFVDMDKQPNYAPVEIYDRSKDACCTCIIS